MRGGFRQGPGPSSAPGKATLLRRTLSSPPPPLDSRSFLPTRPLPLSSQRGEVPGAPSADPPASASLTLGFDVIHHGARGLHDHVARPGAPSCVVHSPQGEPGRGQRARSSERARGLAAGRALPGGGGALVTRGALIAVCAPEPRTASGARWRRPHLRPPAGPPAPSLSVSRGAGRLRFSCPISQVLFRRPRALLCSVVEIYSFASY